jgi:hypothetical protein
MMQKELGPAFYHTLYIYCTTITISATWFGQKMLLMKTCHFNPLNLIP